MKKRPKKKPSLLAGFASRVVPPPPKRAEPRAVEATKQFEKDLARERKGKGKDAVRTIDELVAGTIDKLAADETLPERFKDHALTGDWAHHRECHLRPDLLLIYRKVGDDKLRVARIGSHSELFG